MAHRPRSADGASDRPRLRPLRPPIDRNPCRPGPRQRRRAHRRHAPRPASSGPGRSSGGARARRGTRRRRGGRATDRGDRPRRRPDQLHSEARHRRFQDRGHPREAAGHAGGRLPLRCPVSRGSGLTRGGPRSAHRGRRGTGELVGGATDAGGNRGAPRGPQRRHRSPQASCRARRDLAVCASTAGDLADGRRSSRRGGAGDRLARRCRRPGDRPNPGAGPRHRRPDGCRPPDRRLPDAGGLPRCAAVDVVLAVAGLLWPAGGGRAGRPAGDGSGARQRGGLVVAPAAANLCRRWRTRGGNLPSGARGAPGRRPRAVPKDRRRGGRRSRGNRARCKGGRRTVARRSRGRPTPRRSPHAPQSPRRGPEGTATDHRPGIGAGKSDRFLGPPRAGLPIGRQPPLHRSPRSARRAREKRRRTGAPIP